MVDVSDGRYKLGLYQNGGVAVEPNPDAAGNEGYIVFDPVIEEGVVNWRCFARTCGRPRCRLERRSGE